MRIVAGTAKGRALEGPGDKAGIRPTADRVRESLFNVLGQWLDGLTVLDLYAGTGALALEALSRGAVSAVLVDKGRDALALCRKNAQSTGFLDQVEIRGVPVDRALAALAKEGKKFEIVFADPPYEPGVGAKVLAEVEAASVLAEGGVLVIEHSKHDPMPERGAVLERVDERRFGETIMSLYKAAAPA